MRTKYFIPDTVSRVCDIPERLRPREEADRRGVENVSDEVLLAIILRGGVRGANVVDLSRKLLRKYGSLTELAKAPMDELMSNKGIGKVKAQVLVSSLEMAKRLSMEAVPEKVKIRTPADASGIVVQLLEGEVRMLDKEVFWCLMLDAKNNLKGRPVEVTKGLVDASLVHPREVFREAIRSATAAVVLVHNHPSGDCSPSPEDIHITKQLVDAGKIVDIKVLDHVIVGRPNLGKKSNFLSLREEGLVSFN